VYIKNLLCFLSLRPTPVPKILQPILIIVAKSLEVGQHLVHEGNVTGCSSIGSLAPTFGDHKVPGPDKTSFRVLANRFLFA
jgi:hypothetical protein